MAETIKPCPFCGHPRSRLMHRTEYRENEAGLVAYNYQPRIIVDGITMGGDELETKMLDFRHVFYRRCNRCGARSRAVKTDWHVRTEDEAEDFSIYGSQKDKQWGFDPESEWARPWREAADEAWNRRAERTCRDTDHDTESITCSECGEITRETLFWVDVDGGKTVKGHRPRFCSNCGARLVGE